MKFLCWLFGHRWKQLEERPMYFGFKLCPRCNTLSKRLEPAMSTKRVTVPHGFILVDDKLWGENITRMKDGKSLKDCHDAGECPKDCPLCETETS